MSLVLFLLFSSEKGIRSAARTAAEKNIELTVKLSALGLLAKMYNICSGIAGPSCSIPVGLNWLNGHRIFQWNIVIIPFVTIFSMCRPIELSTCITTILGMLAK